MIMEELMEVLKINEKDTIKGAVVKGLAQGAMLGFMYLGALHMASDIVSKFKK